MQFRKHVGSAFAHNKDQKEENTEHKAGGGDAKAHEHDKASHDVVMQVLKDTLPASLMRVLRHRVLGDEALKSLIVGAKPTTFSDWSPGGSSPCRPQ